WLRTKAVPWILRKARWKGLTRDGGSRSMSSWTLDNRVSGGRVVRIFVHRRGELVDQWFIVAIDDDEQAKIAIAKLQAYVRAEIITTLSPTVVARWNLRQGEIKPAAQVKCAGDARSDRPARPIMEWACSSSPSDNS